MGKPAAKQAEALQFNRAEFDAPAPSRCAKCETALAREYWAVNGQPMCARCRESVAQIFASGGGLGRFARAAVFGGLGGIAGAVVYFAVGALTGYEFSLIAILVGWLVGAGVRAGSRGRGGFAYQALAVVITYGAIVSTYVPTIVGGIREHVQQAAQHEKAAPSADEAVADTHAAGTADEPESDSAGNRPPLLGLVFAFAVLFALACAVPFLGGTGNLLGLLIIGIGLHQAWTMNRPTGLEITGPHEIAPANG